MTEVLCRRLLLAPFSFSIYFRGAFLSLGPHNKRRWKVSNPVYFSSTELLPIAYIFFLPSPITFHSKSFCVLLWPWWKCTRRFDPHHLGLLTCLPLLLLGLFPRRRASAYLWQIGFLSRPCFSFSIYFRGTMLALAFGSSGRRLVGTRSGVWGLCDLSLVTFSIYRRSTMLASACDVSSQLTAEALC